jgi:hypothetical protein
VEERMKVVCSKCRLDESRRFHCRASHGSCIDSRGPRVPAEYVFRPGRGRKSPKAVS